MKSKQTLKVGQRYRVIKDINNFKVGNILTIKKISTVFPKTDFIDTNGYCWNIKEDPIQLLPKKEVKKVKLIACDMGVVGGDYTVKIYGYTNKNGKVKIVRVEEIQPKQSTPKKKSKEIKEIEFENIEEILKDFSYEGFEIENEIKLKINALIKNQKKIQDTINLLIKDKNANKN